MSGGATLPKKSASNSLVVWILGTYMVMWWDAWISGTYIDESSYSASFNA
jgi:hypothetical protein